MTQGRLQISNDLLVQIISGLKSDDKPRVYRVVKNALPNDTEVVGQSRTYDGHTIEILVESPTLNVVNGIVEPPWLEAVYSEENIK